MSASSKNRWTRFVKRGNLPGGRGRESRSDSGSSAALLSRLRRLEKVVLYLTGDRIISTNFYERLLTAITGDVSIVAETSAGSRDQREALLLSLERSPDGQTEGDDGIDG